MFPPPTGNPNKQDIAVEAFYEAGTATGIEGIGGEQTSQFPRMLYFRPVRRL